MQTLTDTCVLVLFPLELLILPTTQTLYPSCRDTLGHVRVSLTLKVNALTIPCVLPAFVAHKLSLPQRAEVFQLTSAALVVNFKAV